MTDSTRFTRCRGVQQRVRSRFLRGMASEASRLYRLHRIDVIARRNRRQQSFRQRKLLRICDVALLAVPPVSGVSHFVEVDRNVPEPVDREIIVQLFSGMNLVNHRFEVNGFSRQLVSRTTSLVVPVGVVAHDAELHVLAAASV